MNTIRFYLLWMALLLGASAAAQPATLTAESNKERIVLGERLKLTLRATLPRDASVAWPRVDSLAHFEILEATKLDSQLNAQELILRQSFTLTSFDSGRWTIPSFSLAGAGKTKPIAIEVGFSDFDPRQPYHDVKDIAPVARAGRTAWYWYVIGALLLVVVLWLLFPDKKKKPVAPPVPDESIYEKSLARLDKLREQAAGDARVFYTELVDVLRAYLKHRKGIESFTVTTDDLAEKLGGLSLSADQLTRLRRTLQLSDLVKFARLVPPVEENQTSLEVIRQSIIALENPS